MEQSCKAVGGGPGVAAAAAEVPAGAIQLPGVVDGLPPLATSDVLYP